MMTLRLFDGYDHTSPGLRPTVREFQALLRAAGHQIAVDGYYGQETMDAVEQLQGAKGLPVDGVASAATWAALGHGRPASISIFDTSYGPNDLAHHLEASRPYVMDINRAAAVSGYPVAIVWAIGSRESGWGLALKPKGPAGTGDFAPRACGLPKDGGGFGRGLMQVDWVSHEFARTGPWFDPSENITYAGTVMAQNVRWQHRNYPAAPNALRISIAAYNCGPGNVAKALKAGRSVDYYTAHRDYSRDVLERAGWFQRHGW